MIRSALLGLLTAIAAVLILSRPLLADPPAVTPTEVAAIQARIPNCERCTTAGAFATAGDAHVVAQAIATVATSREDACDLALFAAWEGGNLLHAVGDGGLAHGPWQLHADATVAEDPVRAARCWLSAAHASREACSENASEERLAALVSGSCERGREKARHRYDVARAICGAP